MISKAAVDEDWEIKKYCAQAMLGTEYRLDRLDKENRLSTFENFHLIMKEMIFIMLDVTNV